MEKTPPKMKIHNNEDGMHDSVGEPYQVADDMWCCECLDCHQQFEWDEKTQQWRALSHGFFPG